MRSDFLSGGKPRMSKRLGAILDLRADGQVGEREGGELFDCTRKCNPAGPPNGCFLEGTKVLLAGGKLKSIEKIQPMAPNGTGDRLWSLNGRAVAVVDVISGPEELPLVELQVEVFDGQKLKTISVSLTEKHPVLVRFNYLIQASWIEQHDQVHTMYGPGLVTNVQRKTTKKLVWNVIVGEDDFVKAEGYSSFALHYAFSHNGLIGLAARDHVVFANGIALGTWALQTQLAAALKTGTHLGTFL